MPSNHLILFCPLLLLRSIFPSIRVFSNKSVLRIRWPKYWNFNLSISPSNEHPGLISFRKDWLDFLAVQGTLKRLLQHHSSKASILQHSAFFILQLSHPTTQEKTTHGHHQMVNTEIRLIIFFAAKDGEAPYSQQKQDQELTVAQIMNSLLPNSDWIWRK